MNCTQANQISIVSFLNKKGHNPVRISGSSYFYFSPLRNDENPSFNVSETKNLWIDRGTGNGGTLVDLVKIMFNCQVSEALEIISGSRATAQTSPSFFSRQQNELSDRIKIMKIQPIQNKILINYALSRGIQLTTASKFLKEAYWTLTNEETGKPEINAQSGKIFSFFALSFENDLGGYAFRNQIWKGSKNPTGITTITGNRETLNIFEGFFNFLSCLTWVNADRLNGTTVVLNSLSNIEKLPTPLNFGKINLFLDNSNAGIIATNQIINAYPNAVNQSALIYPGYEDFNDFLTNKKTQPNENE